MSGWYPDPTGRFEYRYHNDHEWTADVSSGGRRFVDQLVPAPATRPTGGSGLAVAGMVCGIVAVVIAWIPFVAVLGIITAVVGLALSIPALAASRRTGDRRGFAIAGIVTSACGLLAGVIGIVLTVVLWRAVERYEDPGRNEARLTDCSLGDDGDVVAHGEIENRSGDEQTYTVRVQLSSGVLDAVLVEDVAAGETAEFEARDSVSRTASFEESDCRILSVNGPPPFGLDPDLFE